MASHSTYFAFVLFSGPVGQSICLIILDTLRSLSNFGSSSLWLLSFLSKFLFVNCKGKMASTSKTRRCWKSSWTSRVACRIDLLIWGIQAGAGELIGSVADTPISFFYSVILFFRVCVCHSASIWRDFQRNIPCLWILVQFVLHADSRRWSIGERALSYHWWVKYDWWKWTCKCWSFSVLFFKLCTYPLSDELSVRYFWSQSITLHVQMSKDDDRPFLLSGCKVLDGFGTMMVCP